MPDAAGLNTFFWSFDCIDECNRNKLYLNVSKLKLHLCQTKKYQTVHKYIKVEVSHVHTFSSTSKNTKASKIYAAIIKSPRINTD